MQKFIILLLTLAFLFSNSFVFASSQDDQKFIDVKRFLEEESPNDIDIGYMAFSPQFEEDQKPENDVAIEIFYGEIDDSENSKKRLEWLKYQIEQDAKSSTKLTSEIVAYGPSGSNLKRDSKAKEFIKSIKLADTKVQFDSIPENLKISSGVIKTTDVSSKSKSRIPAGISGRTFWTMVRGSAITTGTSLSIYYSTDVDPLIAFSLGIACGLSSGGITYFSAIYGKFLTSGAWASWLLSSDSLFAKGIRKSFGIDGKSISKLLSTQEKVLLKRHPELAKNPELFKSKVIDEASKRFNEDAAFRKRLVKILGKGEEYLKWWITEVLFTVVSLKIPQSLAGIGVKAGAVSMIADSLVAGTMGFISQGPADIAIQLRKYQKIEELRDAINKGLIQYNNKELLLAEIDKVLAKEGVHANYVINDKSHFALKKIENWARGKATVLSFISVMGVGLKVAKIPLSDPILISLGVYGAFSYASVQGVFKKDGPIRKRASEIIDRYSKGLSRLKPFYLRYCGNFFKATI